MNSADYFISGIWVNGRGTVTDLLLHRVTNDGSNFMRGVKTTESEVIKLIEQKQVIKTISWNYWTSSWNIHSSLIVLSKKEKKQLRSKGDLVVKDNLLNLPNMTYALL